MIQRIQTVFLFLVSVLLIAACFFPLWSYQPEGGDAHELFLTGYQHIVDAEMVKENLPYGLLGMLAIAAATISAISVFQFKDRMKQLKLGYINAFMMLAIMGGGLYFINMELMESVGAKGAYGIGFWLVIAAVVCNMAASKFIRKDEELVRSMDRMR
ncbi:DUF4293 domain-containing protein [Persicobacter diffluens]|uniref:Membrane protein n=1 Tax=Persicobacter diffluens TaxID=981 RepID=A0AAN5AJG1_9BACT|nr:membrane protein [Persicobacter diffluens]